MPAIQLYRPKQVFFGKLKKSFHSQQQPVYRQRQKPEKKLKNNPQNSCKNIRYIQNHPSDCLSVNRISEESRQQAVPPEYSVDCVRKENTECTSGKNGKDNISHSNQKTLDPTGTFMCSLSLYRSNPRKYKGVQSAGNGGIGSQPQQYPKNTDTVIRHSAKNTAQQHRQQRPEFFRQCNAHPLLRRENNPARFLSRSL